MRFDKFELSVAVPSKHGYTKIPEYGRNNLTFVEGRRGQPFILKLRNDCAQRVLSVVSIDGINIIDGQPCTPESRGYVVPAYTTVDIQGWRTSLQEVSSFTFEAKDKAYAQTVVGGTQNCGVIAAKFFSEKWQWRQNMLLEGKTEHHHHHHHHHPYTVYPVAIPLVAPVTTFPIYTCSSGPQYACANEPNQPVTMNNLATVGNVTAMYTATADTDKSVAHEGLIQANVPDFKLGTGWGAAKADSVSETTFDRDTEICTITLYYAEAADLEKIGVNLAKDLAVTPSVVLPQAFGFCRPPVSR